MWLRAEKGCILRTLSRSKDLDGKESACNVGDLGSIPGSGISPGEENGNPLQDSGLENAMERGALWATVHGVAKSWTQLSYYHTHTHTHATAFCYRKPR